MGKVAPEFTTKNVAKTFGAVFGIATVCVFALIAISLTVSGSSHTLFEDAPATKQAHAEVSAQRDSQSGRKPESVQQLSIGTNVVKIVDSADQAFSVLKRFEVGEPQTESDPQDRAA